MTIKAYAIATKAASEIFKVTEGKEYPILKISYTKLNSEGLVTIITDNGNLLRVSASYFNFIAKK